MNIGIIDYGSGNIRSVSKSFERAASELKLELKINVVDSVFELTTLIFNSNFNSEAALSKDLLTERILPEP
jgi:hypothetical protein